MMCVLRYNYGARNRIFGPFKHLILSANIFFPTAFNGTGPRLQLKPGACSEPGPGGCYT